MLVRVFGGLFWAGVTTGLAELPRKMYCSTGYNNTSKLKRYPSDSVLFIHSKIKKKICFVVFVVIAMKISTIYGCTIYGS